MRTALVLFLASFGVGGCATTPRTFPLLAGLRHEHLAITTSSRAAQDYFDQGLTLYWSFDHEEATRSFTRAAELDPASPMPHWGIALAAGPHINNASMDPEREAIAQAGLAAARERLEQASALERELVAALGTRYAAPPPADRRPLDLAYATAMDNLWRAHPDHAQIGALYAEARMDLVPWDLFAKDGTARPETGEILAVLEQVLALDPDHAGANHLAIHAWEMSPTPEKAALSADKLRTLVPLAPHLVHMPAHIDVRRGHYDAAVRANQAAVEAARARVERTGSGGFYALYRAHNYHFLVYAAMFEGRYALALENARELLSELPLETVAAMPAFLEGFLATPLHVYVRFGKWEEILAEPEPAATFPGTRALWHYARGLAYSATARLTEASAEHSAFETACAAVPEDYSIGNNSTRTVLAIARAMLAGELEYRRGDFEAAFAHLREAVASDEALKYDEPWGWFQPAAHALGALLLERGRLSEAEAVYRHDLELHPNNGWSLHGLAESLQQAGHTDEARAARARFQEAWARADTPIRASCFCRAGA